MIRPGPTQPVEVKATKSEVVYKVNDIKLGLEDIRRILHQAVSEKFPALLPRCEKATAKELKLSFKDGWIHIHLPK